MSVLENLEPKRVFHYFEEIANIPHGSRDTKRISDYLVNFGKEHHLETYQDEMNNVILIKEATTGYENVEPIIIQGHMDMVCEKESDSNIDFSTDPLSLYIDGDFVKAEKTTLGGDDGIAVAYALAILESDQLRHPRLEVVITVDEEIGMLGAFGMDLSVLKGKRMLNIDSDEEGHFLTGCAGGMSLLADIPVARENRFGLKLNVKITGLDGGHSGAQIDKEHGNANILMGRLFASLKEQLVFSLIDFAGGTKDNAIPRESFASLLIDADDRENAVSVIEALKIDLKKEFAIADPNVTIEYDFAGESTESALSLSSVTKIIFYLREVPNGMLHMSQNMKGLVETSLNLGILELQDDQLHMVTSIRSSVSSRKEDLKERVRMLVEMLGGEITIEGDYPAWEYIPDSPLRDKIAEIYQEQYHEEPIFEAIHAGLECGIFYEKLNGIDCVSFGPNNYDIHTPKERLSISSTERVWKLLIAILERANEIR